MMKDGLILIHATAVVLFLTVFQHPSLAQSIENNALFVCLRQCDEVFLNDAPSRAGCAARCKTENGVDTFGEKAAGAVSSGMSHVDSALRFLKGYFGVAGRKGDTEAK